MGGWEVFADGAAAAEDLAADLGVPIEKKDPPVLSTPGYEQAVRILLRLIAKTTGPADREAFREFARLIDREWGNLSEEARARVISSAARSILGVPALVIGPVQKAVEKKATEIVRIAKRDAGRVHRLRINPTFTLREEKVIQAAAESQGNYITDRYRNRVVSIEKRARKIVSEGLEKGLGRQDIGALLRSELIAPALRQSAAYWETLASIHIGRARSLGQLSAFIDAGIEEYEWESVLDEVTTDICRFLHGKRFNVAKAHASFMAVEESDDPKSVEKHQPWMRTGKTQDGGMVLFVDRGGDRTHIADVHESGVGTSDKIGSYQSRFDGAGLQRLGVGSPPAHPRCRSTILPV